MNLSDASRWADQMRGRLSSDLRIMVKQSGRQMQRDARSLRLPPKVTTGMTNRSIEATVTEEGDNILLRFWIDPSLVTTSSGFNRAWGQNDGTWDNYRQGKISPPADSRGGRRGLVHQDFMGRAWERNIPPLMRDVENLFRRRGV